MKNRLSTILTVILVAALVLGAVCIGGVKGYKEEREELLLTCMEMHVKSGAKLADSIEDCEEDAADFDWPLLSACWSHLSPIPTSPRPALCSAGSPAGGSSSSGRLIQLFCLI